MTSRFLKAFRTEDRGQDLAEYCLLTALVALVALGIIIHASGGIQALWSGANTSLTAGKNASSAPASGSPQTAHTPGH
jgi:Flp pilus assembly pilin Flp